VGADCSCAEHENGREEEEPHLFEYVGTYRRGPLV
jgi:hypothetical protein